MAAAPALLHQTLEAALRAAARSHRSAWRKRMTSWQAKALLLVFVVALGLLQGTRIALGRVPLPSAAALPDAASPPVREPDWRRGHFFRPADSTAKRPPLALRPRVWRPAHVATSLAFGSLRGTGRVHQPGVCSPCARACSERPDGSC